MSSRAAKWAAINGGSLNSLRLSNADLTIGGAATTSILGATAGSVLTASGLPAGFTLNSAARTITGTPTAVISAPFSLTETLAGKANSPKVTGFNLVVSAPVGPPALDAKYLGQVGCRCVIADQLNAGVAQSIQRRAEFARDDIEALRLVYGNYYIDTDGAEKSPAATRDIRASIEYPAGTFTQVKFSGAAQGTMASGQPRMVSDEIAVAIPKGAQFWVTTWQNSTGGILYTAGYTAFGAIGDQGSVAASVADTTMSTWTGTAGGNPYGPYAIIASTRLPSVAIIGDSRAAGTGQTSNTVPYAGEIMPQVAPFMGAINLSRGSQTARQLATGSFTKRAELLQYVSHGIIQVATNDIQANGRTAAEVLADRSTIRSFAPNRKWWQTTVGPKTTSSDSWATVANQTLDATNSIRTAFNDLVRAGVVGFDGFFDMADAVESSRNSGKWKAPPQLDAAATADGNHSNNAGYGLSRTYLNASALRR